MGNPRSSDPVDVHGAAHTGEIPKAPVRVVPAADAALYARGATLRHPGPPDRYGRRRKPVRSRDIVSGGATLRMLVAPGVLGAKPIELNDDRHVLLGFSLQQGVEVLVEASEAAHFSEYPLIATSIGREYGLGMREVRAERGNESWSGAFHERGMPVMAQLLDGVLDEADASEAAKQISAFLMASEDLGLDLFMTNRHKLIATRNRPTESERGLESCLHARQ